MKDWNFNQVTIRGVPDARFSTSTDAEFTLQYRRLQIFKLYINYIYALYICIYYCYIWTHYFEIATYNKHTKHTHRLNIYEYTKTPTIYAWVHQIVAIWKTKREQNKQIRCLDKNERTTNRRVSTFFCWGM